MDLLNYSGDLRGSVDQTKLSVSNVLLLICDVICFGHCAKVIIMGMFTSHLIILTANCSINRYLRLTFDT